MISSIHCFTAYAVRDATLGKKAVRADNTEVPVHLWDVRISGSQPAIDIDPRPFRVFANLDISYFSVPLTSIPLMSSGRNLERTATRCLGDQWMAGLLNSAGDYMAFKTFFGMLTIQTFSSTKNGSKTYYFCFPIFYRKMVRDGCKPFMESELPHIPADELQ